MPRVMPGVAPSHHGGSVLQAYHVRCMASMILQQACVSLLASMILQQAGQAFTGLLKTHFKAFKSSAAGREASIAP